MKYRSLKPWKYELLEEMECYVNIAPLAATENEYIRLARRTAVDVRMVLTIYPHYAWDGPSGPTFDTKTNMRASLFHDALCQLIGEGLLDKSDRKYADELLRTHMLEDQVLYADGLLQVHVLGEQVKEAKKMKGWKRAIYLRWGRFRANSYYNVVRARSRLKGM